MDIGLDANRSTRSIFYEMEQNMLENYQKLHPMENKYAGMTVNKRLYVSGLMDEFDKAVERKDAEKVRGILQKVELTEESIKPILEKLEL